MLLKLSSLALAGALFIGSAVPALSRSRAPDLAVVSGTWATTYGLLQLEQHGASVTGHYTYAGGATVEGHVDGPVIELRYAEPGARGKARFVLDAGATSFSGTWRSDDGAEGGWSGVRAGILPAAAQRECVPHANTAGPGSFAGTWMTTYGPLTIAMQSDGSVHGTYDYGGPASPSSIDGQLIGRCLAVRYVERDAAGQAYFVLDTDGRSFAGRWLQEGGADWHEWAGGKGGRGAERSL